MLGSNLLVTADRDRSKGCGNTRLRFVGHIDLLFVWIRQRSSTPHTRGRDHAVVGAADPDCCRHIQARTHRQSEGHLFAQLFPGALEYDFSPTSSYFARSRPLRDSPFRYSQPPPRASPWRAALSTPKNHRLSHRTSRDSRTKPPAGRRLG